MSRNNCGALGSPVPNCGTPSTMAIISVPWQLQKKKQYESIGYPRILLNFGKKSFAQLWEKILGTKILGKNLGFVKPMKSFPATKASLSTNQHNAM